MKFAFFSHSFLGRIFRAARDFLRVRFFYPKYAEEEIEELNNSWVLSYNLSSGQNFSEPGILWIGHSTFLMNISGKNFLTDPVFGQIPYFFKFDRITPPGVLKEDLPNIDFVLISHNHPDHFDLESLSFLYRKHDPIFLVPLGLKNWFIKNGFNIERVMELNWWEKSNLTKESDFVRLSFLPAAHWSCGNLLDFNKSICGGWMIESSKELISIFFSGDTAYGPHFKRISQEYENIDIALLDLASPNNEEDFSNSHLTSNYAGKAFLDLNAKLMIPMHWGAYRSGRGTPLGGIRALEKWWERNLKNKNPSKKLFCMKIGEKLNFKNYIFEK